MAAVNDPQKTTTELTSGRISVTLKGDLSAPWVVVEGTDASKVTDLLRGVGEGELLLGAAALAAKFGKLWAEKLEEVRPDLPGGHQPPAPANPVQSAPVNPPVTNPAIVSHLSKGAPTPTNDHCATCGAAYGYLMTKDWGNGPADMYVCPNSVKGDRSGHKPKFINA
jgi:hypothetical protein